ncbi:MAG: hypothetical protein Q9159_005301 [Coniocarpon cinnabarinum]
MPSSRSSSADSFKSTHSHATSPSSPSKRTTNTAASALPNPHLPFNNEFHDHHHNHNHEHDQEHVQDSHTPTADPTTLTPAEEATLKSQFLSHKTEANAQFGIGDYTSALQTYDKALASLPTHLDYEVAVLKSNIAACRLRLREWKEAETSASDGIRRLEKMDPLLQKRREERERKARERKEEKGNAKADAMNGQSKRTGREEGVSERSGHVEEIDDETADLLEHYKTRTGHTRTDVSKIYTKLLLRRGASRSEQGGWQNLEGAFEDYTTLHELNAEPGSRLSHTDKGTVQTALATLPGRINGAREKEMGEMMGKLKDLGNGILKPFGLSTENFKFEQQAGGGYGMSFERNPGAK